VKLRVIVYESAGRPFESGWARQKLQGLSRFRRKSFFVWCNDCSGIAHEFYFTSRIFTFLETDGGSDLHS